MVSSLSPSSGDMTVASGSCQKSQFLDTVSNKALVGESVKGNVTLDFVLGEVSFTKGTLQQQPLD